MYKINMKVCIVFVCLFVVACSAAPKLEEPKNEESIPEEHSHDHYEVLPGVFILKDSNGENNLNVKFAPGELRDAARTFEEARGKIKKYTPLLAGVGVKVMAVLALLFGGLTVLVTKALVVAKIAFFAAAALGLQKFFSSGLANLTGKIANFPAPVPQWSAPTAPSSGYPYARSSTIGKDASDLAFKAHIPGLE